MKELLKAIEVIIVWLYGAFILLFTVIVLISPLLALWQLYEHSL